MMDKKFIYDAGVSGVRGVGGSDREVNLQQYFFSPGGQWHSEDIPHKV